MITRDTQRGAGGVLVALSFAACFWRDTLGGVSVLHQLPWIRVGIGTGIRIGLADLVWIQERLVIATFT